MKTEVYPLRLYVTKRQVYLPFSIACAVIAAMVGYLATYIGPQDSLVFLHYNILFGVDALGEWWQVYLLPVSGAVVLLVNTVIGWLLYGQDRFAATLLLVAAAVVEVVLFIAAYILVFLNT